MAIQSLVRSIMERKNIPRKWKPVETVEKPKKNKQFVYDKLENTDIEEVSWSMKCSGNVTNSA